MGRRDRILVPCPAARITWACMPPILAPRRLPLAQPAQHVKGEEDEGQALHLGGGEEADAELVVAVDGKPQGVQAERLLQHGAEDAVPEDELPEGVAVEGPLPKPVEGEEEEEEGEEEREADQFKEGLLTK